MIRDRLRGLARKILSPDALPAAASPAPSRPAPAPTPAPAPAPAPEPEPPEIEVEAAEVRAWMAAGREVLLLDIREPHELDGGYAQGALIIPMNSVPERLDWLPRDRPVAVYCAAGVRSFGVAHWLRERGVEAWSLPGGFGSWVEAGGAWTQPPWPAPRHRVGWPARLSADAAASAGLPPGSPGIVHGAAMVDGNVRYTFVTNVTLDGVTSLRWLRDLPEEALTR